MDSQVKKAGQVTEACCPPSLEISPPPYWRDPQAPLERRVRPASWANRAFRANLENRAKTESMGRRD